MSTKLDRSDIWTALAMTAVSMLVLVVAYALSLQPMQPDEERLDTVSSNIVDSN